MIMKKVAAMMTLKNQFVLTSAVSTTVKCEMEDHIAFALQALNFYQIK